MDVQPLNAQSWGWGRSCQGRYQRITSLQIWVGTLQFPNLFRELPGTPRRGRFQPPPALKGLASGSPGAGEGREGEPVSPAPGQIGAP